jgi:hypothetical protein
MGWLCAVALVAMLVSGCATTRPASTTTPEPAAFPRASLGPQQRVVAYPQGRWLLYGDGSTVSPYSWVWVPTGAAPPPPAPPAR